MTSAAFFVRNPRLRVMKSAAISPDTYDGGEINPAERAAFALYVIVCFSNLPNMSNRAACRQSDNYNFIEVY